MKKQLVLLCATAAVAIGPGAATPAPQGAAQPSAATKRCKPGFRHAVIAGKHKCLRAGQRCTRRLDRRYHRYGFHCHSGRLARQRARRPSPSPARGVLDRFQVPGEVYGLAVGADSIWAEVAPPVNGIVRVDRSTRAVTQYPGGASPIFRGAELWAPGGGRVVRLDPRAGGVLACGAVAGARPVRPADGAVWASSETASERITRFTAIDAATMAVGASFQVECRTGEAADFRVGYDSLWHACKDDGTVLRIDPATGRVLATIPTGAGAHTIAIGHGSVWVTNYRQNTVSRVDPASNAVVATVRGVGSSPGVVAAFGAVWSATGNTVVKIDPATNAVAGRLTIREVGDIYDIVEAEGSLWLSATSVHRIYRIDPAVIG